MTRSEMNVADRRAVEYNIKVVFFDIGNVILHFSVAEIARKMAWAVRRRPLQVGRYLWNSEIGAQIERGDISGRELYRRFREDLGFNGDFQAFRKVWCDHFHLDRSTSALVKAVAARKKVYLLSNTNHLHYEFIRERFRFPEWVDGAMLSYRLGLRKPDPRIYFAALKRARVEAENALFIDDIQANVEAARKVGMKAILYSGGRNLRRQLIGYGVL